MLFDTDDNYVVLEMTGPDGKERRYELLDIVEFEGVAYGVFCPQEFPEDGDIILFAGKGHEDYQLIEGKKVHFVEREIIQEICREKQ